MAVKTYVKSQHIKLSKNFDSWELRCGLGRGCNCTTTLIDEKLVEILQKIRDYFGVAVTITSAYRCPSYNLSVGGAVGSYHSRGMAADITVDGVAPRVVAAYAESIGVLGIGLYETASDGYFVHVDTRTYKSFWYGKKEAPRTTFGGAAACAGYGKGSSASSQNAEKVESGETYTVKAGDTLAKIAAKYPGVTYQQIAALNAITAPYIINVGQKLSIPTSNTSTVTKPTTAPQSAVYSSASYENSPDDLYWFFMEKIGNAFGVCGLIGNLNAESDLVAACLEIAARNKLGYTSKSYTDAVDSGKYKNFANDCCGYGIAQWTDSPRKAALLAFAKAKSASIGNRRMQAEYLMEELNTRFLNVLNILKTATSVRQASDAVITRFECPYDQGESMKARRASYGENYYQKFKNAVKPTTQSGGTAFPYFGTVKADLLNVRSGNGTNYSIIRRLATGAVCTIVEEKDGWGKLSDGGWVSLDYIQR